MRKMTFVLVLVALLVPVSMLYAQCEIDLHEEMLTLMSAQIQADTGDTATAVATLEELSTTLSTIAADCASASAPLELGQQYVAQNVNFVFRYPENWVVEDYEDFAYVIGSSQAVLNSAMNDDVPQFDSGEMLIMVVALPLFGESFKSTVSGVTQDFIDSEYDIVEPLTPTTIAGRDAFDSIYTYDGDIRIIIQLIDYSDAYIPSMTILLGFGNIEDEVALQVYMTAIAESVEYPPIDELRLPEIQTDSL